MVKFFIHRPVFAWVISILIMLAGVLAILSTPVSQYPPIAPPAITVSATYPGASARTVENTVTQVIEQKMTGLDNLLYFSSTSDSAGNGSVTLTFRPGTDPDVAWSKVQNKLDVAKAMLPEVVQQTGVTVTKSTRNFFMVMTLTSRDGSLTSEDLQDYMASNMEGALARVDGVGQVDSFGTQHAMRIWLDPNKLVSYNLTPGDLRGALQVYNAQVSAGQAGGLPAVKGQSLNVTVNVQAMLETADQFGAIPVRINSDGSTIRIRDVARTELGTEAYVTQVLVNGRPAAGMMLRLGAGANALDTARNVKAKMDELARYFPAGVEASYPYETTPFVSVAIHEVAKTLIEAVVLVFFVMLLFLGNVRATLIPTIAVPVVLLGTFAMLQYSGMSINMLTMFAMVLAIGLLVDDAIVVVENVERIIHEEGLSVREATIKSMEQVTGALIGVGLVLAAVFGPMAFFGGSTGIIYRQFSVTLITSMLLSVAVALILTPSLCIAFLRPAAHGQVGQPVRRHGLQAFFQGFDRAFEKLRDRYEAIVGHALAKPLRYVMVYVVIVAGMAFMIRRLPTAYVPEEDQGSCLVQVMLPAGTPIERTRAVMNEVEQHFLTDQKEAVQSCMTVAGYSLAGQGQNTGMAFVKLKDWDLRRKPGLSANDVVGKAMATFMKRRDARIFAFAPPAVIELGTSTGFDFELQDRGGLGHEKLMEARNQLLGLAAQSPAVKAVRPNGFDDLPEYDVHIDNDRAGALGVAKSEINDTLSTAWGGSYVNDFSDQGRVKRVYLQADAPFRSQLEDLDKLYVRNAKGEMTPFSAFSNGKWSYGSPNLQRYNAFPAVEILGEAASGHSTGEAMQAMEELAQKLPKGIGFEWTSLSYQERMAESQGAMLYGFSILVIFLCVAALFESWTIPFVNLLMLPLGVFGALAATSGRGLSNDIYFRIGFLTTMGLSTKNAILIIQFIKEQMGKGDSLVQATLAGIRIRFRPVIMTSLAFFLGTLPLALAFGAGAGAMKGIGTAVTGGMLSATFIDLLFIPLFFVLVSRFFGRERAAEAEPDAEPVTALEGEGV
jgi:hydrophobe/amphiphile efflux-1 (HAE1) family protein